MRHKRHQRSVFGLGPLVEIPCRTYLRWRLKSELKRCESLESDNLTHSCFDFLSTQTAISLNSHTALYLFCSRCGVRWLYSAGMEVGGGSILPWLEIFSFVTISRKENEKTTFCVIVCSRSYCSHAKQRTNVFKKWTRPNKRVHCPTCYRPTPASFVWNRFYWLTDFMTQSHCWNFLDFKLVKKYSAFVESNVLYICILIRVSPYETRIACPEVRPWWRIEIRFAKETEMYCLLGWISPNLLSILYFRSLQSWTVLLWAVFLSVLITDLRTSRQRLYTACICSVKRFLTL